ncbi:unnamed protein product [Closterium sp. Naga37s-1]|nr:unnamed protein product [Closterium sp. Naga37s-1]
MCHVSQSLPTAAHGKVILGGARGVVRAKGGCEGQGGFSPSSHPFLSPPSPSRPSSPPSLSRQHHQSFQAAHSLLLRCLPLLRPPPLTPMLSHVAMFTRNSPPSPLPRFLPSPARLAPPGAHGEKSRPFPLPRPSPPLRPPLLPSSPILLRLMLPRLPPSFHQTQRASIPPAPSPLRTSPLHSAPPSPYLRSPITAASICAPPPSGGQTDIRGLSRRGR